MTREETVNLIRSILSLYPNWNIKKDELSEMTNAWHWILEEYPAPVIKAALMVYVKTNTTGFAPSVSQIINSIYTPQENERLSEGEAWAMVKRAISDGAYHSEERFNALPPLVQRAVGDASMIHQWSQTDSDEVNTVVMSNFQRTYRAILSKQDFNNKVPANLVKELTEQAAPRIGVTNE